MSAGASGEAMEIVEDARRERIVRYDGDEIDRVFSFEAEHVALSIDALVARKVEEERERCAKIAESSHPEKGDCCFEDGDGHRGRVSQCDVIAAAIRSTPPGGAK